ncbi:MAG: tetratricopeptide repeat protein [Candidatus Dadabacteria bacterium]|nr:MAG: tetratricopeptide repeat protein [Candidatus Dadabacteria bacterium]
MNKVFNYILALLFFVIAALEGATLSAETKTIPVQTAIPEALKELGVLFDKGRYKELIKRAAKISAHQKRNSYPGYLAYLKGLVFQKLGDHNRALASLQKAHSIRPSNSDFSLALARTLMALGQNKQAAEILKESIWFSRFKIETPERAYLMLGEYYSSIDDTARAEEMLKKALSGSETSVQAALRLTQLYAANGNIEAALGILRAATAKNPDNPELKIKLARNLLRNVNRDTEQAKISEALKLSSSVIKTDGIPIRLASEARALYIKSLLESGDLATAEKELQSSAQKGISSEELNRLKAQLEIEKKAKRSTHDS